MKTLKFGLDRMFSCAVIVLIEIEMNNVEKERDQAQSLVSMDGDTNYQNYGCTNKESKPTFQSGSY